MKYPKEQKYHFSAARSHNLSAPSCTVTSLEICNRCGANTNIVYAFDHTNERKMCTECYEFIHWAINNNSDRIWTSVKDSCQQFE